MKVGDTYARYEDLTEAFTAYKHQVSIDYWVRDAKTIDNQRKKFPETVKNANPTLKYYSLVLACFRGSRKYNTKIKSVKQGCPANIQIRMSLCKQYLTVIYMNEEHNHESPAFKSQKRMKNQTKRSSNLERGRTIKGLVGDLMDCLSSVRHAHLFDERVKVLENLCEAWKSDQEVMWDDVIHIKDENRDISTEIKSQIPEKDPLDYEIERYTEVDYLDENFEEYII